MADFLSTRKKWLKVKVVPGEYNDWDVVLVLDGHYFNKEWAETSAWQLEKDLAARGFELNAR